MNVFTWPIGISRVRRQISKLPEKQDTKNKNSEDPMERLVSAK